jgi:hypothetical protein
MGGILRGRRLACGHWPAKKASRDVGQMESMTNQQGGPPQGPKSRRNGSEKVLGTNSEIGRKLGEYFRGMEAEPVPDSLLDLVSKLEQVEKDRAGKPKDKD